MNPVTHLLLGWIVANEAWLFAAGDGFSAGRSGSGADVAQPFS